MGEKRDQKDIYEADSARFGQVDDIKDLERERGVGPNIATHERERLLAKSDSVGYFEVEGGSKGGLGASLHLGEEIMREGSPNVGQYQVAYNSYAQPLRKTYRAMGRLKDLSMTNAALTPAEVEKDPNLMAHFKNLKTTGGQDLAMTGWSNTQSNMVTNIQRFSSGQHLLAGAMANYSRVEKNLQAKRKEFEKAAKQSQIDQVDETVKTLHKIIDVASEAWTLAGSIDNIIGSSALDENAGYADGEVEFGDQKPRQTGDPSTPDWAHGTGADAAGERHATSVDYGTKKQKIAGTFDSVTSGTAEARLIMQDLKQKMSAGQNFELSIDGILTAVVGGKKYTDLKKDVAKIEAEIRKLGLDAEADDVTSATEALSGFKIGFNATRQQLKNDRVAARDYARNFASAIGLNEHGTMSMYAAEAYQELAAYGRLANGQLHDLLPTWGKVKYWMRTTDVQRFVVKNMVSDGRRLGENLNDVIEQRNYLHNHLHQWTTTARQWNDFFGKYAKHELVHRDNAADKSED